MTALLERPDWKPRRDNEVEAPYPKGTAQFVLWRELEWATTRVSVVEGYVAEAKAALAKNEAELEVVAAQRDALKAALEKLGPA